MHGQTYTGFCGSTWRFVVKLCAPEPGELPWMSEMSREGEGRLRMGESQWRVGDEPAIGSGGGLLSGCRVGLMLSYFVMGLGCSLRG